MIIRNWKEEGIGESLSGDKRVEEGVTGEEDRGERGM